MPKSYLTEEEITALQNSGLCRKTPYLIDGVSKSHFSIVRYYGGCDFQGKRYTYIPPTDELIRDDVLKWITKERKKAGIERKKLANAAQGNLF